MNLSCYGCVKAVLAVMALEQFFFLMRHLSLLPSENQHESIVLYQPTTTTTEQSSHLRKQQQQQQQSSSSASTNPFRYKGEPTEAGILSHKDPSYFRAFQQEIDEMDDHARCERYGFKLKKDGSEEHYRGKHPRRIFFGSLVATEPWEVYEIVSAESYGIYEAIVLSESNRTQNFTPRNYTHYHRREHHEAILSNLFGIPVERTKIVSHINEVDGDDMTREYLHRDSILQHWKALGMQPDDVGLLSDIDEVLTRDFLRAIQTCDVIDRLDFETHQCHPEKTGVRASTQVYEGSPECPTIHRWWYHPSLFPGHCLEGIGNLTKPAKRDSCDERVEGCGRRAEGWSRVNWNESNPYYPYLTGSDFRLEGGETVETRTEEDMDLPKNFGVYTAFHLHNFFANSDQIRFKYRTYGHANKRAYSNALRTLSEDIDLMVSCATDQPPNPKNSYQQVPGGFEQLNLFTPIYFKDSDYRRRRQEFLKSLLEDDHLL